MSTDTQPRPDGPKAMPSTISRATAGKRSLGARLAMTGARTAMIPTVRTPLKVRSSTEPDATGPARRRRLRGVGARQRVSASARRASPRVVEAAVAPRAGAPEPPQAECGLARVVRPSEDVGFGD